MKRRLILSFLLLLCTRFCQAQSPVLQQQILSLLKDKQATVGVLISSDQDKDVLSIRGDGRFPMQSVYKFPIALAVLAQIDSGRFSLEQLLEIKKEDLLPGTWSPIRERFPNGTSMSIAELIRYTVGMSDNNGCDILLRLIGGPGAVEGFLRVHGLMDISVKTSEEEAGKAWKVQFRNWATPKALNRLLVEAYRKNDNRLLSLSNYDFIWKVMAETATGPKRIKGGLSPDIWVAHKTGTSGVNSGLMAAVNDIGAIRLSDGRVLYITVLVTDSRESLEENERIIAAIAKYAVDFYQGKY